MEKFVYYTELYNIYAFLLTDKQREISDLYFNENLSLSEIADNKKVSKSYVGKIVNNTIKKLEFYESNLKHLELLQKK
jgi:predicted DNA-binding protein YlxM (UPF0122 family)